MQSDISTCKTSLPQDGERLDQAMQRLADLARATQLNTAAGFLETLQRVLTDQMVVAVGDRSPGL